MESNENQKVQARRNFLKGSAAMGLASVATTVGAASIAQAATSSEKATEVGSSPDFMKTPEPIPDSKISKTIVTDVVVIGAALSGISAARAALEAGAKVVVIEKSTDIVFRSSDVGVLNSSISKKAGVAIDPSEVVNRVQDYYGWRCNTDLWRYWAERSGEALDWWLSATPNYKVVDENAIIPGDTKDVYVRLSHWPYPKGYDFSKERVKSYPTSHQILPNMGNALRAVKNKCEDMGGTFLFSTWARQLIRPNNQGRVLGVIAQDRDGNYTKILANKGVVLCTGDYANDRKMVERYCPQVADLYPHSLWFNNDAENVPTNTGDGHKMGVWVGAQLERGPHAPMTHSLGGPLGVDAFLLVNNRGERFMNEDNDGQFLTNAIERQPKSTAFQIFDDNWRDQLSAQAPGLGNYTEFSKEQSKFATAGGFGAVTTEEAVRGKSKVSDTLEGLAQELHLPPDKLVAAVQRYNELARVGKDTDFFKRADRLFPIKKAPFYGGRTMQALLVVLGGLTVSGKCEVLDKEFEAIPGLHAAGNVMGGRFSVDYGLTVDGASHGTALTFGRLAGEQAAKG